MLLPTYGAIISVFLIYYKNSAFSRYTKKGLYFVFFKFSVPMILLFIILFEVTNRTDIDLNNWAFLVYLIFNGAILDYIFIKYYYSII